MPDGVVAAPRVDPPFMCVCVRERECERERKREKEREREKEGGREGGRERERPTGWS